jgi:O-antigen/teichoic acid export membrane protein
MLLSTVVTTAAYVLQLIILARLLSPAEFGLIGMLLIVVGFAQAYADLGLSAALVYRRDDTPDQRSSLYWLNLFAGAVLCVGTLVALPLIESVFGEPRLGPYVRVVALMFIIVPLGKQFEVLLQKELSFRALAIQEAGAAILATAVVVVGAASGLGVWAFVAGTLVNAATRALALLVQGLRRFRPSLHFRLRDLRGYLGFGAYQLGERTVNYMGQRIDQILVGSILGTSSLGFYTFAFNLAAQPGTRINPAVSRVAFPALAATQDNLQRLQRGFLDIVRLLTTVNAPVLLGLAAVAPSLVPAVFGEQWRDSVVLVQLLCGVSLMRSIGNPIGSLQLARGRADLGFKWNLGVVAMATVAVILGARLGGTTGVALGLILQQLLLFGLGYRFLVRPLAEVRFRVYVAAIARPAGLGFAMAMVMSVVGYALGGQDEAVVATIQLCVGSAVYAAALWRFEPEVVSQLRGFIRTRS